MVVGSGTDVKGPRGTSPPVVVSKPRPRLKPGPLLGEDDPPRPYMPLVTSGGNSEAEGQMSLMTLLSKVTAPFRAKALPL